MRSAVRVRCSRRPRLTRPRRFLLTTTRATPAVAGAGLQMLYFGSEDGRVGHALPTGPAISFGEAFDLVSAAADSLTPDALFMVQPTPGSTGAPKLVRRSHRAFARYAKFVGSELGNLAAEPRFLAVSALTHAFGLHTFATVLSLGAELVVPAALDTSVSLDEVRVLDPVVLPMTPRVLRSLYRQAADEGLTRQARFFGPSARALLIAGGKSDPGLLRNVEAAGIEVIEWYGSSEASLVALTPWGGRGEGYAGRIVDDTTVRVATDGELLVRSPGLMLGYGGDEGLTRSAFTGDGFYRTGDIGDISSDGLPADHGQQARRVQHPGRLKHLPGVHRVYGRGVSRGGPGDARWRPASIPGRFHRDPCRGPDGCGHRLLDLGRWAG